MAYHEHDIREKFLVVGNKRSIVDLPVDIRHKITFFAGRLGDDIVENKRLTKKR